jgi:hypothetical protein
MRTLLLWIWVLGTGHATQVRYEQLPCPLDPDDIVRVYQHLSSNTQGGYDSDLAQYSSDGQFRTYAVATCAENLFSLRSEAMSQALPPELLPALSAALSASRDELAAPSSPQVWERYAIAARMHEILGATPLELAELYMQASWTARDSVVGFHRGLEGPDAVAYVLEQGPAELDKPLSIEQRRAVLYSLARVAHRGGFGELREESAPMTAAERQTVDTFRQVASVIEPHYQDLAIAWLSAALDNRGALSEGEQLQATYLLADLCRRRGRSGEASVLYREVAAHPSSPDLLREMASSLLTAVGG